MCGIVSRPSAQSCEACGFHFDDVKELKGFLTARLTTGWFMVIGGIVFTALSAFAVLLLSWLSLFLVIPSVALFVKGTRIVDVARRGLREQRALPAARVVKE